MPPVPATGGVETPACRPHGMDICQQVRPEPAWNGASRAHARESQYPCGSRACHLDGAQHPQHPNHRVGGKDMEPHALASPVIHPSGVFDGTTWNMRLAGHLACWTIWYAWLRSGFSVKLPQGLCRDSARCRALPLEQVHCVRDSAHCRPRAAGVTDCPPTKPKLPFR